MPTKYVTVDGTAVNYFHTGPTTLPGVVPDLNMGELLLCLHGAGSNGNSWWRQLGAFADSHSPLAFDFPGHGRSGGTESLKSIEAYRDCLATFMDALRLRPAVLIGRSMGGAIAMAHALAHPERVRGLVLVATAAHFELAQTTLDTWKNVMLGRAQQPFSTEAFSPKTEFAVMREMWMEQVKTDPRVRYFDLVACNQFDIRARLGDLTVPTLIVAGRDDTMTPLQQSEVLHDGIQGSKLVVIDDAGHTVPNEKPEEFNSALRDFLSTLPSGSSPTGRGQVRG
ncbi:MAG TPA: alpha/beta hydrolase [Candidatus Margulisiibacteriota bacterium]|nr:alpha/beta hydrolase [Candidatus Margulisiibacteriota bacterium]